MTVLSEDGTLQCEDERRSGVLLDPAHPLNGIDFVEFRREPLNRFVLDVTFLKPPPVPPAVGMANFTVTGGIRIVDLRVVGVETVAADPLMLRVLVDREGDFSPYVLEIDHPAMDLERNQAVFSFKAACPSEFDCRVLPDCPPPVRDEPALDYLAKDYQSFRRLMVDLIAERNPSWQERLPADLGMTIVELMAYAADYLSYYQDAGPGTEGYLDTCLHRISAARHGRLIDYQMGQGRNATTFVHLQGGAGANGVVPAATKVTSLVAVPLLGAAAPPGAVMTALANFDGDPALADALVFELLSDTRVLELHNELRIHSWGDRLCCLSRDAREIFLYRNNAGTAVRPDLRAGEYLLLEEVRSPMTGLTADADPKHRQVLLIGSVENTEDAAFTAAVAAGVLTPRTNPADPALPLLRVVFAKGEALKFAPCISAETIDHLTIEPVTVARGNIAVVDHGRSIIRDTQNGSLALPDMGSGRWPIPELALPDAPVTRNPEPAIALDVTFPADPVPEIWTPVPNLIDSQPFDQNFVVETDNNEASFLRFGDDQYGRRPFDGQRVVARYRIGNGKIGNVGWGTLVHLVDPGVVIPAITRIWQPLPAEGGVEPETTEHLRQIAPEAFRAIQFRAVTERDWEEMALRHPDVAAAKASFRWTGSWHTVFVAIHPVDAANLRRLPGGGTELQPLFALLIKAHLTRFKLAGYDLNIRAAIYVPLEIDIRICVGDGHFRGDVLAEVGRVLSNRRFADGTTGFFFPLRFGFGQAVYLSQLYEAVSAVAGVNSAEVTLFKRYWDPPRGELERGAITMTPFEIPRLDNDRNFADNGVLRLTAVGGL
ncbi:MAG: putative baseplate assembly protein [Hyphomicrobiales bacterium]